MIKVWKDEIKKYLCGMKIEHNLTYYKDICGAVSPLSRSSLLCTVFIISNRGLTNPHPSKLISSSLKQKWMVTIKQLSTSGITFNNNQKLVQWASMAQLPYVIERGCNVWLNPAPFDHSKFVIVDDVWVLLGSSNWDPRSFRLNFEFNIECYSEQFAEHMDELFRAKRARSRQLTIAYLEARHILKKLRDGVARLFAPYL